MSDLALVSLVSLICLISACSGTKPEDSGVQTGYQIDITINGSHNPALCQQYGLTAFVSYDTAGDAIATKDCPTRLAAGPLQFSQIPGTGYLLTINVAGSGALIPRPDLQVPISIQAGYITPVQIDWTCTTYYDGSIGCVGAAIYSTTIATSN